MIVPLRLIAIGTLLVTAALTAAAAPVAAVAAAPPRKPSPAAAQPVVPLTLSQAVTLAVAHNPKILQAREEITRATGQVVEFAAARLPTLTAQGQTQAEDRSRFEAQPGFTRTEQGSWNVGSRIRQVVFSGGRISAIWQSCRRHGCGEKTQY